MNYRTKTKPKKKAAECLYCGENIYIGHNPKVGNFVTCDSCDTQFEIVDLDPVMVDWPYYNDDFDGDEGFSDDIDDEYSY